MPLHALTGHQAARRRLSRAVAAGKLPQVLVLTGPAGVGKQRLALWLAQLVLCQRPTPGGELASTAGREAGSKAGTEFGRAPGGEPCGACRACHLVEGLSHPDLHWFVPITRPKASEPDKQVEEAAETLAQVMEERRAKPLYGPVDGMASHGVASVRLLQRQAALTSVEGGRRVFIIGEADRLVAQEGTEVAANALLKLLEEPPPGSLFVLTTVDVRRLLPTIRSRSVPVRLSRLTDAEVREFLTAHARPPLSREALEERVTLAAGSIGAALGDGEEAGKAYQAAGQLLEAVLAGPAPRLERALRQTPWSARGDFTAMLDALAETLNEAARGTLGQRTRRPVPPALLRHRTPDPFLQAMDHVVQAREAAQGNVNPQLLLATLSEDLAAVL
jgi:DNA polymerase-3 subunit delta'